MFFRKSSKSTSSLLIIILVLVISFSSSLNGEEASPVRDKRVLIIHSYHQGLAWTDGQDTGIRKILAGHEGIDISEEYLDTKRISLGKISDIYANFIRQKYTNSKFDCVIVTDNNAMTFVSNQYEKLFRGTPVVFSGINDFQREMLKNFDGQASGVVQVLDPKGTYELIKKLQPELETLIVVSGTTPTARAIRDEVKSKLSGFAESQQIVWLDGLDTDDLLERLGKLSDKDAVLLCNFNRDSKGRYYSHQKSGRMISEVSKTPVYAMEDHYLGTGVTGGYMNSSIDQGIIAGKICLGILKSGKIPEVVTTSPNVIMFDYMAMKRFGLDVSKLPDSAVIIKKPVSFYEHNKTIILNTILIFCLLLFALLGVSFGMLRARRAERLLKESEKKYRTLFEQSADAIFMIENNKFIDCNPATVKMFGYSNRQKLLGIHPSDLSPEFQPEGRNSFDKAEEMIATAVTQGSHRFEWYHKRCNGEIFPVEVLLTNIVLADRNFIHAVCRDITDRKRAEQERERNRYFLKRAQEIGHIGTWELDIVTNELVWTEENYNIFGLAPGTELTYETFLECVHPDDRKYLEVSWNRSVNDKVPYEIEHRILVGDEVKWVKEKAELEFDDEGKCIRATGLSQDITERKEEEKQRDELVKSLKYKNRELQDIVYTASHDLRSPLVNIEGFSAELQAECNNLLELLAEQSAGADKSDQIEPVIKKYIPECLRFIISGAKKMSSLLDGLLQVSRIGTVKIKKERLEIGKIAWEVIDAMEHQKKNGNINITVEPLPDCFGDAHMIDHVLTNIISNAIKYRDETKECEIKISGKVKDEMSIYCVEDNGIGIAAEHQKNVFKIFHRLNPQDAVTGEGLGLTIVTRILDRLGGKIWLESEPGKGSKFFIALPAV